MSRLKEKYKIYKKLKAQIPRKIGGFFNLYGKVGNIYDDFFKTYIYIFHINFSDFSV